MAAPTQQITAKIHGAAEKVAAPTTEKRLVGRACIRALQPTVRGRDGDDTSGNPKNELLDEGRVYARVDERDCAATVVPGLHDLILDVGVIDR
jgi:hypothetical protein